MEESWTAARADLGYDLTSGSVPSPDSLSPGLNVADRERWFDGIERCVDVPGRASSCLEDAALSTSAASCIADAYVAPGLVEEALMEGACDPELDDRIDIVPTQAMADCRG